MTQKVGFQLGQILGALWMPVRILLWIALVLLLLVASAGFWFLVIGPWIQSWNLGDKVVTVFLIMLVGLCWAMERLEHRLTGRLASIEKGIKELREQTEELRLEIGLQEGKNKELTDAIEWLWQYVNAGPPR